MPSPRSRGPIVKLRLVPMAIVFGFFECGVYPVAFGQAIGPPVIPKTNPSQFPGPGNSTSALSLGSPQNQNAPQNVGSNQAWVVRNNLLNNAPQMTSSYNTAPTLASFRNGLSRTNPYSPKTQSTNTSKGLAIKADPEIKSNTQGLFFLTPSPLAPEK